MIESSTSNIPESIVQEVVKLRNKYQTFKDYYQSEESAKLLMLAKQKKDISRNAYIKFLLIAFVIIAGCVLMSSVIAVLVNSSDGRFLIFAFIIGCICCIPVYMSFRNKMELYSNFYHSSIPDFFSKYIFSDLSYWSSTSITDYRNSGLADLFDSDRITLGSVCESILTGIDDKSFSTQMYPVRIEEEEIVEEDGRKKKSYRTVFSGFAFSIKGIPGVKDCVFRVDSDEGYLSYLVEDTVESMVKDRSIIKFNSEELNKRFDCKVYPYNSSISKLIKRSAASSTGRAIGNSLANSLGGLGGIAGSVLKGAVKQVQKSVSVPLEDMTSLFSSDAEFDNAQLEALKILTSTVEDLLLYIRRKYGTFNLVFKNNELNIQIDFSDAIRGPNAGMFKGKGISYLSKFLSPAVFNDSDIEYCTMLRLYELLHLEWLLIKYFYYLPVKADYEQLAAIFGENAQSVLSKIFSDDSLYFEESFALNEKSRKEINDEVSDFYSRIKNGYKSFKTNNVEEEQSNG